MQSKIFQTSYVINFLNEMFNSEEIINPINREVNTLLSKANNELVYNWTIEFNIIYFNGNSIKISKIERNYKEDRLKEITIFIPIPTKEKVEWGVEEAQHIPFNSLSKVEKNLINYDIKFSQFVNLNQYLSFSIKEAIAFILKKGIKVNGVIINDQLGNSAPLGGSDPR